MFHLWLFIFNPLGLALPTGFTKAIISLRSLLRFIFNPFGVGFTLTVLGPGWRIDSVDLIDGPFQKKFKKNKWDTPCVFALLIHTFNMKNSPQNPYIAGSSVGGSPAFVGRADILRKVQGVLRHRLENAIVLYGQRRIGKTSVLQELEAHLKGDYHPIFFDLMGKAHQSLDEVLRELAHTISDALGKEKPNLGSDPKTEFRKVWLPNLLNDLETESLVLLFDEFDVLDDPTFEQTSHDFFSYLRDLLPINPERLSFVFVIGRNIDDLNNIAKAFFKNIRPRRVSLLAKEDTVKLIRFSVDNKTLQWSNDVIEKVWQLTNGHPYLTQSLCYQVWEHHYENGPNASSPVVTLENLEVAIPETLESSRTALEWLWDGLPPAGKFVASALAEAGAKPITEAQLKQLLYERGVRVVIQELENAPRLLKEWDLVEDGSYCFRVELLRRWIADYKPLSKVQEELDRIDTVADNFYKCGLELYRQKQLEEEALASLKQAVKFNPNHLGAHQLQAEILLAQDKVNEARELLEKLYEYQPAAARPRLIQALLTLAQTNNSEDEQLKLYQQILELDPEHPEAKTRLKLIVYRKTHNPFRHGNPVAPEQLIGRDNKLRQIVGNILTGQSTLITGSPHCGKTSMLHYLRLAPEEERANGVYGDKADQLIFSHLDNVDKLGTEYYQSKFWREVLKPLEERIFAQGTDLPLYKAYQTCREKEFDSEALQKLFVQVKKVNWRVVLLIDEFERLLEHQIWNDREFFAHLRSIVSSDLDTQGALVLVITSNFSRSQLDKETEPFRNPRKGSPYFNYMVNIVLGALPESKVDELLRQGDSFTEDDRRFIKKIAGTHPYLLQAAASLLWEAYKNEEEKEADKRQQQVREEFYTQVKNTLENIWQYWSLDMQKAFMSVAPAQDKKVEEGYRKQGIDTQKLIHQQISSDSLKLALKQLEEYGFLKKNENISGGWRVSSSVFLPFALDKLADILSGDKEVGLEIGLPRRLYIKIIQLVLNYFTGISLSRVI
jgi:tetratricopeptide (TPR) repeat protein